MRAMKAKTLGFYRTGRELIRMRKGTAITSLIAMKVVKETLHPYQTKNLRRRSWPSTSNGGPHLAGAIERQATDRTLFLTQPACLVRPTMREIVVQMLT